MEMHAHDNRPLYMQLHDLIRDDILNGTYRPGEKILTEEQFNKLTESYSVDHFASALLAFESKDIFRKECPEERCSIEV